ncbi:MAG: Nicotinamidase [uncultured Solirubrobacterales bacterium]|uniref:nicotinamidase n=1 Tax=uncultured Solirubrobacterales bacterium TaxID=768556 RepID=A0A6J4T8X7_9ACTN|nr:MAG: Nicotinamidase [uncultured Solirubrobacterales bacterium]
MAEALLIVDFQNDFVRPDGALSVPGGDEIGARLNELAASGCFDLVVATRDWHPPDHGSFEEQGGPWPAHCVQGTSGAELHPTLDSERVDVLLDTGDERDLEGYSAFERPELGRLLREKAIDAVYVAGLATNVCVRGTALGALEEGFAVTVDTGASRGIDVEGVVATAEAVDELSRAGATVIPPAR